MLIKGKKRIAAIIIVIIITLSLLALYILPYLRF